MQHCRAGCAAAAGPSSSPICLRLRHYKHIHTNTTWHLELTPSTERLLNGFCFTASRRYADPAPPPPWSGFLARGRTQPQALGWLTQMFCLPMLIGLNATRAHFASPRASVHQPQTENVKMWKCGRVPHLPPPQQNLAPHPKTIRKTALRYPGHHCSVDAAKLSLTWSDSSGSFECGV